ncbi:MAG: DUF2269 family protein [Gemmatimonadaceae bacterium]
MYLVFKLIHVVAVVMFLGNITTGILWKAHGDLTGDPRIIAHTMQGIMKSDRWFTIPGVVVIIVAGFGAAGIGHLPLLGTGWILWSIVLFIISGLAFMFRIAPLQRRLFALAQSAKNASDFDAERYRSLSRQWGFWGMVALLTPAAALVLMIMKPEI